MMGYVSFRERFTKNLKSSLSLLFILVISQNCTPVKFDKAINEKAGEEIGRAPLIDFSINPELVDFGKVLVGSSVTKSIEIINRGEMDFEVIGPANQGQYSFNFESCGSVFEGIRCSVDVTFSPIQSGIENQSINIGIKSRLGTFSKYKTISVSGEGIQPAFLITPSFVDFSSVAVGSEKILEVLIKNTGSFTLELSLPEKQGEFDFILNSCQKLEIGSTCKLQIKFIPKSIGVKEFNIVVQADPQSGQKILSQNLAGKGDGIKADFTLNPSVLNFDKVAIGQSKKLSTLINNTGSEPFSVALPVAQNAYIFSSSSCENVMPNSSCEIQVNFAPTSKGNQNLNVQIKASSGLLTTQQTLTLLGEGTFAELQVAPAELDFGTINWNGSSTLSATITNTGTVSLMLNIPNEISDFKINNSACLMLAVGKSCSLPVTFSPKSTGVKSELLVIQASNLEKTLQTTQKISLRGNAVLTGDIKIQPANLDFGKVQINTTQKQIVTISNVGNVAVSLNIPSAMGAFNINQNTCANLDVGATCNFSVNFSPILAGVEQFVFPISAKTKIGEVEVSRNLTVKGEGFIIAPSASDKLALVGWYSYKQTDKIQMNNSNLEYQNCTNIYEFVQSNPGSVPHGTPEEYCYEPSGAHGMGTEYNGKFSDLTKYILGTGSTFSNVSYLDDLFSNPEEHISDNTCFQEALFYYAMSYLIVPNSSDVNTLNVTMNLDYVDDGLRMITNGHVMGNAFLGPVSSPISLNVKDKTARLRNGANTIAAIWVDDCRVDRQIVNARVNYDGNLLTPKIPNVVRGYIYNKSSGVGLADVTIDLIAQSGAIINSLSSDSSGFFEISAIPDGQYKINIKASVSGSVKTISESLVLDHKAASTAVVDFSRGL